MKNNKYTVAIEFAKFTKEYRGCSEPEIITMNDAQLGLKVVDKRGEVHIYNWSQVLAYHVTEE